MWSNNCEVQGKVKFCRVYDSGARPAAAKGLFCGREIVKIYLSKYFN